MSLCCANMIYNSEFWNYDVYLLNPATRSQSWVMEISLPSCGLFFLHAQISHFSGQFIPARSPSGGEWHTAGMWRATVHNTKDCDSDWTVMELDSLIINKSSNQCKQHQLLNSFRQSWIKINIKTLTKIIDQIKSVKNQSINNQSPTAHRTMILNSGWWSD